MVQFHQFTIIFRTEQSLFRCQFVHTNSIFSKKRRLQYSQQKTVKKGPVASELSDSTRIATITPSTRPAPADPLHHNHNTDDSIEKSDYDIKNSTATHVDILRLTITRHEEGQMQPLIMKKQKKNKKHSTGYNCCFTYGIAILSKTKMRKAKGSIIT